MASVWRIGWLVCLGVFLWGGVGCDRLRPETSTAETEGGAGERIGTQRLTTTDSGQLLQNEVAGIAITLTESWSENLQLHDAAELQAADLDNQLYLVVVAEQDPALLRVGLRENAETYRQLLIDRLAALEAVTLTETAFVGDDFASQAVIRGQLDADTPVVYLHTTVVTETRYYQIVAWTTPEQYPLYESELRTIVDSFREIDTAASS